MHELLTINRTASGFDWHQGDGTTAQVAQGHATEGASDYRAQLVQRARHQTHIQPGRSTTKSVL